MITLHTNYGEIKLELDFQNTPNTANNFLNLAKNGHYDGTIFHRVIDNFMIQGGGFGPQMKSKRENNTIKNEANSGGKNKRGTIAMARTNDPHSASSQFFINVADNDFLNFKAETPQGWGYCVFGKVIEGMEVVDKIKGVKTSTHSIHSDVPVEDVVIEKVSVTE